jgi:hypothetical protein
MKIRQGFVSNSSSTSFCLLCINSKEKFDIDIDEDGLEEKFANSDLDYEYAVEGYDAQYIGMSPYQMKDDETLLQFKQRIVDEFKNKLDLTIEVTDLDWEVQGGYDG